MMGQPPNYAGKVIFTCCLLGDNFCQKYLWNPEYFTRVFMNFLIISSIPVKQLKIMEVQHDRDALLNFVWKCLLCNLQQLQCLFVKTITGWNNSNNNNNNNNKDNNNNNNNNNIITMLTI